MKHFSILALLACIALFSCKKKKDDLVDTPTPAVQQSKLSMKPVFGSANLMLDSVYTMSNGFQIKFTELKAYFSGIQSGGSVMKDVALFNFRETGNLIFQSNQVVANPSSIQFGIGVPSSINHNDPSTFPNTNPLNIAIANDMHWDWNPGYIFFKVEAKVDTIIDGITSCDHNLVYHVGTDSYFTNKTISNLTWAALSSTVNEAWLKIDLKNFFENSAAPIDVKTEFTTHSMMPQQSAITEKARQNFSASISEL
ncbi:MbnP family protein [uncultured Fluviicola sp.]|uniref:MbnP family protein n=1 Tax=uncultured Fluviicola sp. TaxID=463303 RepID=UPI0025E5919C|nr:MbnP family protein [uncultured Fluviicola sp.]